MKKIFSIVLGLLLFLCPFAVQAEDVELMPQEEIAEAPALEPMTEEQLNDLLGEEMYLGTIDLRGKMFLPNLITTRKRK